MSINAFIAQGHGRSTDGSSNPYPAGWELTFCSECTIIKCRGDYMGELNEILKNRRLTAGY